MRLKKYILPLLVILAAASIAHADNILFDISHRVVFHPDSSKQFGLKELLTRFQQHGHRVSLNEEEDRLSEKSLEGIDTLVLPGPIHSYNSFEVDLIEGFVLKGGNLLVLVHIAPPLARITERFGIILSNVVISEKNNLIGTSTQDFYARDIRRHPVTADIEKIAFFGSWALLSESGSETLISTSNEAWADANRNRVHDQGEPVRSFGLMAAAESGLGKVVVIADDAPLANGFIRHTDNSILADNIIIWFKK